MVVHVNQRYMFASVGPLEMQHYVRSHIFSMDLLVVRNAQVVVPEIVPVGVGVVGGPGN